MDPTARGDIIAFVVRDWYERNRETWWQRHRPGIFGASPDRDESHADEFMLRFIARVREVNNFTDMELMRDYS